MKTSVRFLAVLVAVLMIATAAISVAAFSDVEEGYEHASAIATLSQLGVINGYADGTFKPENNVERDEMAKLVYVLYTTFQTAGEGTAKFSDLAADNWAAGYVTWCSAKSIVGGYEDGSFRPDNNVTYDEALKMVCATLGYTDFDSSLWPTDVRQKALKDLKLGTDIDAEGSDKLTRGQVAQLLYNALDVPMFETKIKYVTDKNANYEDENGNAIDIKVPMTVAKTLAEDVWNFTEKVQRVVGTKNFGYNTVATASNKDDAIVLATYDETAKKWVADANNGVQVSTELKDLGLEAFEKNTDALIGLDIKTVTKDSKLIAKATVLGSVKVATVETLGENDAGKLITDEIKIDGVVYDDTKNSETLFANLKVLNYATGKVEDTTKFAVDTDTAGTTADLEYPHMALVMDSNGDGVADAIAVDYYQLAEVEKVTNVKATSKTEAYTKYAIKGTNKEIKSTEIADAKTLAKGDVFVYATINGTYYIDEVIAPVTAGVSKVTDEEIFLEGVEAPVKYVKGGNYLKGGKVLNIVGKDLIGDDKKDQKYYLYNGYVVDATLPSAVVDSYDLAIFLYADKATEPVTDDKGKVVIKYPVNLLINGKTEKVYLSTLGTEDANNPGTFDGLAFDTMKATEVCHKDNGLLLKDTTGDGYVDYYNTLVNYTVDEDGNYILKTAAVNTGTGKDVGDTVIATNAAEISINTKTGLYTITDGNNSYVFELDENSVLYYLYDDNDKDNNTSLSLATYTSANILKNFKNVKLAAGTYAYLRVLDDTTYVLQAAFIEKELEDVDNAPAKYDYTNDARKILYAYAGSNTVSVDGKGYYEHAFMDWATLTNLAYEVNAATDTANGAKATETGKFYGWDEQNEVYVPVTVNNTSAVQLGTIAKVDTTRGLIYINGVSFTEGANNAVVDFSKGIKLGDAKILATAKATGSDYKTYAADLDLAKIAEIMEDTGKTLNVAVGVYHDEENVLNIAWIIIDNYVWSETANNGDGDFVPTYDIISSLKAGI